MSEQDTALSALRKLESVCRRMDLDNQDERPEEEEYQEAMAEAAAVLAASPVTLNPRAAWPFPDRSAPPAPGPTTNIVRDARGELLQAGDSVRYVPNHAFGDLRHADCENGKVTLIGSTGNVFVRFGNSDSSKACYADSLVKMR